MFVGDRMMASTSLAGAAVDYKSEEFRQLRFGSTVSPTPRHFLTRVLYKHCY